MYHRYWSSRTVRTSYATMCWKYYDVAVLYIYNVIALSGGPNSPGFSTNCIHYNWFLLDLSVTQAKKCKRLLNILFVTQFIGLLSDWFAQCFVGVRWGSAYSCWFKILAGVGQGGILSPILFMYISSSSSCGLSGAGRCLSYERTPCC